MIAIYLIFLFFIKFSNSWSFSEQNDNFSNYSNKMKVDLTGYMLAFGDFNADRATDIFVLDLINKTKKIDVILMDKDSQNSAKRLTLLQDNTNSISAMIVGDFDGDSILDLIIYRGVVGAITMEVAYGKQDRSGVLDPVPISTDTPCGAQPLHLDYNADMIGDLLCQLKNSTFIIIKGQKNRSFSTELLTNIAGNMDTLMYSKFFDMDKDGQADILLIGRNKNNQLAMTSLIRKDSQFINHLSFLSAKSVVLQGQGVVGDFLLSGELQILIPVCGDSKCANSYIMMCSSSNLTCVDIVDSTFMLNDDKMRFVPGNSINKLSLILPEVVPLSCGDIHLSGHIECLVIVAKDTDPTVKTAAVLVLNGRNNFTLKALEGSSDFVSNVTQVAIFDLLEDGIPDVITVKQQGPSGLISPLLHDSSNDQYFIKVLVLNGLCSNIGDCPGKKLPYGIPLPGISVSYSTESSSGGTQESIAAICPDSDFTSLQLPYVHFGLGAFANYVEKLYIKLPFNNISRQHTLSFIVPKTQIVVIPYPLDDPSKWTNKLFLEPFHNMKVIYVAAALLGTFLIVSIIVCILQYLEVRVDKLEKMQESQKFHFDAM